MLQCTVQRRATTTRRGSLVESLGFLHPELPGLRSPKVYDLILLGPAQGLPGVARQLQNGAAALPGAG